MLTTDELMAAVVRLGRAAHTSRIEGVTLGYMDSNLANAPAEYRAEFVVPRTYAEDVKGAVGLGASSAEALQALAACSRAVLAKRLESALDVQAKAVNAVHRLDELMELANGLVSIKPAVPSPAPEVEVADDQGPTGPELVVTVGPDGLPALPR